MFRGGSFLWFFNDDWILSSLKRKGENSKTGEERNIIIGCPEKRGQWERRIVLTLPRKKASTSVPVVLDSEEKTKIFCDWSHSFLSSFISSPLIPILQALAMSKDSTPHPPSVSNQKPQRSSWFFLCPLLFSPINIPERLKIPFLEFPPHPL